MNTTTPTEASRLLNDPSASLLARLFDPQHVRTAEVSGKMWYCAKDACAVIGIADQRQACEPLDKDEVSFAMFPSALGPKAVKVISKEGALEVLLRSRKPQAREFKRWLVHTVLETLRERTEAPALV